MNINKIFFSFALVFIVVLGSSLFTIFTIEKLTTHTQKMYTHPFNVSNAISNIQTSIITMHRNMKDVVLTKDSLELIKIIEDIQKEEEEVYKNFELIYQKYLGEKKDIDLSYKAFKNWKLIRQEVISLMYKKEVLKAITITKGKGAKHIDDLYKKIDVLKKFAFNKANEYYELSIENTPLQQVILIYFLSFLITTLIIFYVTKSLLINNKVNKKQLYLIDQNILIAKLNLNKNIIEISSALCCVLDIKKENILNTTNKYLFTNEEYFKKFENIISSGKKYQGDIPIEINNITYWYEIEVIPHFDDNYTLNAFTILLTNISDKKEIEKVSITDTLTGIYNRNYFEIIFSKEVKKTKKAKKELSVIMIDIDYFKKYNDTYGHQEGDLALKAVSTISSYTNRSHDYCFRIGGEEFVIISYQKDLEKLNIFTDIIINAVEKLEIPHKNNEVSKYITISAGAIQFGKDNLLSTDKMYKRVDDLLYKAKESGRNNFKSLYL